MGFNLLAALTTALSVVVICSVIEFLATLRFSPGVFALGPVFLRDEIPLLRPWPLHFAETAGATDRAKFAIQEDHRVLFRHRLQFFQFQTPLTYKGTIIPTPTSLVIEARAPLTNILLLAGFMTFAAIFATQFSLAKPHSTFIVVVLVAFTGFGFFAERRRARDGANEVVSELLRQGRAA